MHLFTTITSALYFAIAAFWAPSPESGDERPPFQSQAVLSYQFTKDLPVMDTACGRGNDISPQFVISNLFGFPYVGAAFKVSEDTSEYCTTCWKLSYGNEDPIYMLAVDETDVGFVLSKRAWNELHPNNTDSDAVLPVTAQYVDREHCDAWPLDYEEYYEEP